MQLAAGGQDNTSTARDEFADEAKRRIDLALATNTAKQIDRTLVPQLGGIVLIVALFEPRLETTAIWWWAAAATFNVGRGALFNHLHKRQLQRGNSHTWPAFLNTVFSLFFGVLWGSLVVIADKFGDVEDRLLALVIALAVMSLTAVVSAGSRSMYITGVIGNMATIAIGWALMDRLSWMFAGLLILYFVAAAFLHDTVYRLIRASTEAMYRNEILTAQLEVALAYEDPLTKLRNRDGLHAWFDEVVTANPDRLVAVAVGNVERLSAVNELFGAEHGDDVLATLGRRLTASATPSTAACRLAGDEFAVVELFEDDPAMASSHVEQRLREAVREGFDIDGQLLDISISTAVECGSAEDFEQLLVSASGEVRAERSRRAPSLSATYGPLAERRELIDDLRRSLSDGTLAAWFQPIINSEARDVIAWEALARWTHPVRGQIPPTEFLGLVELGRLVEPFTDQIIEDSVRFIDELLRTRGPASASVHVNLTAGQARRPDIVAKIEQTLSRHRVAPSHLTVELTEQDVPHVDAQLTENLRRLEALGIGVSIDDFGTGYSSLSHLFDLRPTELKIDKRFVDGLPNDPTSAGLVRGVLGLARGMGLFTVAEGVENEEQAEFLSLNGCDSLQGFLTSPALPPDEALRFRVPSDASSADRVG